jgi:GT2 family glycosyltransferase
MTALPPVHVVILTYNGWRDTIACLESVLALDYPDVTAVVCDNASADGTIERIASWCGEHAIPCAVLSREEAERGASAAPGAKVVAVHVGGNNGFAIGNNVGLRFMLSTPAAGYAWLLNNDTVVEPDALRHMVVTAESDPRIGLVGATILDFDPPHRVQEAGGGRVIKWPAFVEPNDAGASNDAKLGTHALEYISGACMLIRRPVLAAVGLLDERFFLYAEDIDFGLRVRQAGFTLAYCEPARIRHRLSASHGQKSLFKDYHITRSTFQFAIKHSRMGARSLASAAYQVALPKLMRGEWKRLGAVMRGYRDARRDLRRSPTG